MAQPREAPQRHSAAYPDTFGATNVTKFATWRPHVPRAVVSFASASRQLDDRARRMAAITAA